MNTLFDLQKSDDCIRYGTELTETELINAFGVYGDYCFTKSRIDDSSFLFYGRSVRGNTKTEVDENGDVKVSTPLRSNSAYEDGLMPEDTEIGDVVFLIQKIGKHYKFKGVADLNEIKITRRKLIAKGDKYDWTLECVFHGKIRDEENAYSLIPVNNDELETVVYIPTAEGRKKAVYSTKYERKPANRNAAIAAHGTVCMACGFDFEKMYGKYGAGYIEVHHTKPLFENDTEVVPDPETDLICLCANCHRMVHHFKKQVLSLDELKEMIAEAKVVNAETNIF